MMAAPERALPCAQLDALEEHPHYYCREVIPLRDESDAWVYLLHDEVQLAAIRHDVAGVEFTPVEPPGDWRGFFTTRGAAESLQLPR